MTLTLASLFAGMGGFDLAAERGGMRVIWQSEIEPNACRVLRHHWPGVTNYGDVTGIRDVPAPDVLVGGFPCQDISVAGRREGLAGTRSGLWWEFHRLVDELRPRWVVIENVPGLLSSNGGRDMGAILGALGQLGYGFAYGVLDAQHFGLAQRRKRVFIVGHSGSRAAPATVLFEPDSSIGHSPPRRTSRQGATDRTIGSLTASGRGVSRTGESRGQDPVVPFDMTQVTSPLTRLRLEPGREAPTLHADGGAYVISLQDVRGGTRDRTDSGQGIGIAVDAPLDTLDTVSQHGVAHAVTTHQAKGGDPTPDNYVVTHALTSAGHDASEDGTGRGTPLVAAQMQVRRLTPTECLRLMGFPDTYLDLDPPLSDSAKYRLVGNTVAVPVVKWLLGRIAGMRRSSIAS